jgi:hypothetical protein
MSSILSSAQPSTCVCVRDLVLCKVCRDCACAYLPFEAITARAKLSASILSSSISLSHSCEGGLTRRHDDNNQQDDDADDDADAHLHVLPPHLLAHAVGAAAEALRGRRQVFGLVLKGVEAVATLRGFVQVVLHHAQRVVDLLLLRSAWLARLFAGAALPRSLACAGHAAGRNPNDACSCSQVPQMPLRRWTHLCESAIRTGCLLALWPGLTMRIVRFRTAVHCVNL